MANYTSTPADGEDRRTLTPRVAAHVDKEPPSRHRTIVIAIICVCVVAIAIAIAVGVSRAMSPVATSSDEGADGTMAAIVDDEASSDANPLVSEVTDLGDETELTVTPDDANALGIANVGASLDSATLALDSSSHAWVTLTVTVSNPSVDQGITVANDLALLVGQGDQALVWDADLLRSWRAMEVPAASSNTASVRVALADPTEPLVVTLAHGDAVMGWTVDVAAATEGIDIEPLVVAGTSE